MFARIIVPLDGTAFAESALVPATELARAFGAALLLVRSVAPAQMAAPADGATGQTPAVQVAGTYLDGAAERLRATGHAVSTALAIAPAGAAIAATAQLEHADLIVMTAHLRWKQPVVAPASTTLDVLLRSRLPVLVWRAAGPPAATDNTVAFQRKDAPILVPLDGSARAESALPMAEALARAFNSYLVLLRVVSTPRQSAAALKYVLRIQGQLEQRAVPAFSLVHVGEPLSVIERTWREQGASLILLASRGQGVPGGMPFGSLAACLVEDVEAPLLVLRSAPEDAPLAADLPPAEAAR